MRFVLAALMLLGLAAPAMAQSSESVSLKLGGSERRYLLHAPGHASTPRPLVLALHPLHSTPEQMEQLTGFSARADKEGFAVAYPAAIDGRWKALGRTDEDVDFLKIVIDDAAHHTPVDKSRVYVIGFSNGAQMAWRFGCRAPNVVAAMGSVAGSYTAFDDCINMPLPAVVFHGTADTSMPYNGRPNQQGPRTWGEALGLRDGCVSPPLFLSSDHGVVSEEWGDCVAPVRLYSIRDKGHSWPGSDMPEAITTKIIDATALSWDFFKQFKR